MCGKRESNCIESNLEAGTGTAVSDGYSALCASEFCPSSDEGEGRADFLWAVC